MKSVLTVSFAPCVSVCRAWLWILTFWRTVIPAARRCRSQTPGPRSMTRDVKAWTRAVSLICLSVTWLMHCTNVRLNGLSVYSNSEMIFPWRWLEKKLVVFCFFCGLLCLLTSSVMSLQKWRKARSVALELHSEPFSFAGDLCRRRLSRPKLRPMISSNQTSLNATLNMKMNRRTIKRNSRRGRAPDRRRRSRALYKRETWKSCGRRHISVFNHQSDEEQLPVNSSANFYVTVTRTDTERRRLRFRSYRETNCSLMKLPLIFAIKKLTHWNFYTFHRLAWRDWSYIRIIVSAL